MRTFLILFSAAILIIFVQAQQKPKPVVNLANRPRPIWNRPPEERRKLSIFPKKDMKFVVTPKIVINDDEEKKGPSTKRPLMRKFVMRDKNERGTWSFAPREPLMKTQRFTVTLAPPKSNHHETNDEIPEESHKVQTVIRNMVKIEHDNKAHNINKGNLIEMTKINKNLSESKTWHKTEQNPTAEEILQSAKVNDTQDNQVIPMSSDNPLATFGVDLIDIRSFNDDGVTLDSNETINKDENTFIKKTTDTISSKVAKDFIESRALLDFEEIKYPIDQSENNSLVPNSEGGNNSMNFNDLKILLEKIVNNTEDSSNRALSDVVNNNDSIKASNETSVLIKDIPKFDVSSLGTNQNENMTYLDLHNGSVVHKLNNSENENLQPVRETNALNDEGNFTEPAADTFIPSNLASLINFMENGTFGKNNITDTKDIVGSSRQENKDSTVRPITASRTDSKVSNYFANDTEDVLQTQSQQTYKNNNTEDSSSQDLSLEIYESDIPLSSEEFSTECDECDLSLDAIPNKPISNLSSNEAEERSNESLMSELNTLTNEESNESSSNSTSQEISKESYPDKNSNSDEAITNESRVESSDSFTNEQFSNESSSNMAGEEISNESYPDKSNNLTEETSNESIVESSKSFTGEQFSNESSSNVDDDELLDEDILSESRVDSFDENILKESSNISEEQTLNESYLSHDISEESMEASNNFTGEVISNDLSSNIAGEKPSNESRIMENVSAKNINGISNNTNEEMPMELIENSDNVSDERIPEELAADSEEANTEKIAEQALIHRFKRSNNIIEEESVPTTVSGFKYSGHEGRLNHDLSYKNINA